ncbi:MAG: hypothetical protein KJO55_03885, partial [Gammaproteobacteria bacterium]|nr:hypothetical protein [Gammaproteobacteria bacterium]
MLQEAVEPLAYELAFWMQGLDNPEMEIAEVAKLSAELASGFRAMAIIAMATAGSIDGFCHNLIRSALVRSRYLQRVHDSRAFDSHHFASGRYKPLADAIAAGEYTLAAKLHQLSPTAWQGRREYRDDFCFGRLLGNLLLPEEG